MQSLVVQKEGHGNTLVFLHGFCENHQIWVTLTADLKKNYQVVSFDLPGFGNSKLPIVPFTIQEIGQQVIDSLTRLDIVNPVLIGHSLGGYVALAMAASNPDLFSGLVLFHSTPLADSEEKKIMRNKTIDFVRDNGVEPFIDLFVPSLFYQKNHPDIAHVKQLAKNTSLETIIAYTQAMRDRPPQEAFLKTYKKPVLVIGGKHDPILPIVELEKSSQKISRGHFSAQEQTAHMGMFENPQQTLLIIKEFAKLCVH